MFFKKKNKTEVLPENIPHHIAIIMDGNGRWASKRALPRSAGHKVGADNFRTIARYASNIGVKVLTLYAFSTENWNRPKEEVSALMKLFKQYLEEALEDFLDENMKVRFLGDISAFSEDLRVLIDKVHDLSKDKTGMTLNLAMNYGGRDEIIKAAKEIHLRKISGEDIDFDEETFSKFLYTKGEPDPDLIIRPSGEQRISNFMLWQCAYSEFVYFDILWPDFKPEDLLKAIDIFNRRNRRFGGT